MSVTFNCQTFLLYLYTMKNDKENNEGNKRMAIFLDYSYHPWNEFKPSNKKYGEGFITRKKSPGWWKNKIDLNHKINFICRSHNELSFRHDWKWLMKVVEKIESIYDNHHGYFGVYIISNSCTIQGTKLNLALKDLKGYGSVYFSDNYNDTKILATWDACDKFLEWYDKEFKNR